MTFHNHAYELHRRYHLEIMIILEPRIVEERAQVIINTLPYNHSRHVDPTSFSRGVWLLWNESPSFIVSTVFMLL